MHKEGPMQYHSNPLKPELGLENPPIISFELDYEKLRNRVQDVIIKKFELKVTSEQVKELDLLLTNLEESKKSEDKRDFDFEAKKLNALLFYIEGSANLTKNNLKEWGDALVALDRRPPTDPQKSFFSFIISQMEFDEDAGYKPKTVFKASAENGKTAGGKKLYDYLLRLIGYEQSIDNYIRKEISEKESKVFAQLNRYNKDAPAKQTLEALPKNDSVSKTWEGKPEEVKFYSLAELSEMDPDKSKWASHTLSSYNDNLDGFVPSNRIDDVPTLQIASTSEEQTRGFSQEPTFDEGLPSSDNMGNVPEAFLFNNKEFNERTAEIKSFEDYFKPFHYRILSIKIMLRLYPDLKPLYDANYRKKINILEKLGLGNTEEAEKSRQELAVLLSEVESMVDSLEGKYLFPKNNHNGNELSVDHEINVERSDSRLEFPLPFLEKRFSNLQSYCKDHKEFQLLFEKKYDAVIGGLLKEIKIGALSSIEKRRNAHLLIQEAEHLFFGRSFGIPEVSFLKERSNYIFNKIKDKSESNFPYQHANEVLSRVLKNENKIESLSSQQDRVGLDYLLDKLEESLGIEPYAIYEDVQRLYELSGEEMDSIKEFIDFDDQFYFKELEGNKFRLLTSYLQLNRYKESDNKDFGKDRFQIDYNAYQLAYETFSKEILGILDTMALQKRLEDVNARDFRDEETKTAYLNKVDALFKKFLTNDVVYGSVESENIRLEIKAILDSQEGLLNNALEEKNIIDLNTVAVDIYDPKKRNEAYKKQVEEIQSLASEVLEAIPSDFPKINTFNSLVSEFKGLIPQMREIPSQVVSPDLPVDEFDNLYTSIKILGKELLSNGAYKPRLDQFDELINHVVIKRVTGNDYYHSFPVVQKFNEEAALLQELLDSFKNGVIGANLFTEKFDEFYNAAISFRQKLRVFIEFKEEFSPKITELNNRLSGIKQKLVNELNVEAGSIYDVNSAINGVFGKLNGQYDELNRIFTSDLPEDFDVLMSSIRGQIEGVPSSIQEVELLLSHLEEYLFSRDFFNEHVSEKDVYIIDAIKSQGYKVEQTNDKDFCADKLNLFLFALKNNQKEKLFTDFNKQFSSIIKLIFDNYADLLLKKSFIPENHREDVKVIEEQLNNFRNKFDKGVPYEDKMFWLNKVTDFSKELRRMADLLEEEKKLPVVLGHESELPTVVGSLVDTNKTGTPPVVIGKQIEPDPEILSKNDMVRDNGTDPEIEAIRAQLAGGSSPESSLSVKSFLTGILKKVESRKKSLKTIKRPGRFSDDEKLKSFDDFIKENKLFLADTLKSIQEEKTGFYMITEKDILKKHFIDGGFEQRKKRIGEQIESLNILIHEVLPNLMNETVLLWRKNKNQYLDLWVSLKDDLLHAVRLRSDLLEEGINITAQLLGYEKNYSVRNSIDSGKRLLNVGVDNLMKDYQWSDNSAALTQTFALNLDKALFGNQEDIDDSIKLRTNLSQIEEIRSQIGTNGVMIDNNTLYKGYVESFGQLLDDILLFGVESVDNLEKRPILRSALKTFVTPSAKKKVPEKKWQTDYLNIMREYTPFGWKRKEKQDEGSLSEKERLNNEHQFARFVVQPEIIGENSPIFLSLAKLEDKHKLFNDSLFEKRLSGDFFNYRNALQKKAHMELLFAEKTAIFWSELPNIIEKYRFLLELVEKKGKHMLSNYMKMQLRDWKIPDDQTLTPVLRDLFSNALNSGLITDESVVNKLADVYGVTRKPILPV